MTNFTKRGVALALIAVSAVLILGGCQKGERENTTDGGDSLKVVLYINGNLGDKSFFDSAARGLAQAEEEFGLRTKVVEGGGDLSRWEPDIAQLCEGDWDIIILGTWKMLEFLQKYAPLHPEKRFFIYDTKVDYTKPGMENVYSILYSQNEGSFLMGALAAMITRSNLPAANEEAKIGFMGGMDIPIINDFRVGFEEGALYVDPDVEILASYTGTFFDAPKGKEMTLALYNQGVDVTFNVAAEAGLGGIDAAKERGKYLLGVDSDQYKLFSETDADKASWIVSSMMKNVDASLYRALKMHIEGTLPYGTTDVVGLAEGGVGLADNENYRALISEEQREILRKIEEKIISGEITVGTALFQ